MCAAHHFFGMSRLAWLPRTRWLVCQMHLLEEMRFAQSSLRWQMPHSCGNLVKRCVAAHLSIDIPQLACNTSNEVIASNHFNPHYGVRSIYFLYLTRDDIPKCWSTALLFKPDESRSSLHEAMNPGSCLTETMVQTRASLRRRNRIMPS